MSKKIEQKKLGKNGEEIVAEYLESDGFVIKHKNYSRRSGEIDIIAEKGQVRAFVEVKSRSHTYFPTSKVVTKSKQKKIILTALLYNNETTVCKDLVYRFDVAIVEKVGKRYDINYIKNAFTM